MPKKRHDTSSDDSGESEDDIRSERMKKRDQYSNERQSQRSTNTSPQKRGRGNQNTRVPEDVGRDSSPDDGLEKSRQRYSSESEPSPVKKSVVSRVEKPKGALERGWDARDFGNNRNRMDRNDRRDPRGRGMGQRPFRRDDFQGRFVGRNNRNNNMGGRLSPERLRRNSLSPVRQRSDNTLSRRQDRQNRSLSRDNNDLRGARNDDRGLSFSPDQNVRRFNDSRNDNMAVRSRSPIRGQRSPVGGQSWRETRGRDRFENENRDQNFGRNQRSRSFDRPNAPRYSNFDRDRGMPERSRQNIDQSGSPVRNRNRNDSDVSPGRKDLSPDIEPSSSRGGQRELSFSPGFSSPNEQVEKSVSPEKKKKNDLLPQKSPAKSKTKKSKKNEPPRSMSEENVTERSNFDVDDEIDKKSDISKKTKNKSKKKKKLDVEQVRDESIERSFERSKQMLVESTHSNDFEFGDTEKLEETSSPVKAQKKSRSKRQREVSESEVVLPKKSKKAKESQDSEKITLKKVKKKSKKQMNLSRSPSPNEQSEKKKRSSERSFGRSHDLAQFESESEPESGEITDSEEDAEGKQPIRSLVNKPPAEEEGENIDDERYMNQKRKASRMMEREDLEKKEQDDERGSKRKVDESKESPPSQESAPAAKKAKPTDGGVEALVGRTGGAYIPPARLRAMQAKITDKSSVEFQRISWEALKKSINGLVNKVNVANIENIVRELFQENIVRGRGLMARSIIQAQAASPTFTHVYAALVAIVNTKFPMNGELILRRLIIQFRRGYKRNDKSICLSSTRFIAHLVNQQVAHEVLALEILTLLLETPTDDSVEVAIGFLKECGQKLTEVSPRGINAIFERLRNVLHESKIDIRVQYMVEVMFAVRKDQFKDFPSIVEELDLVEEEDQFTHLLTLEDATNGEDILNVFKADPEFQENEEKYKILKKEILGEGSSDEEGSGSGSGSDSEEESDEEDEEAKQTIIDQTETNMVALRRTIYLTIQSSLDFEECAHKLMKMDLKPGQEVELCNMILDCCAQMRTYEKFFGLLAGRFCMLDRKYVEPFQVMFKEQYDTIHRLETNKLRNVAKFFAHLLHTDSISWAVMQSIKLNEDDTTSASRIFIKILFQELSEYLGLPKLNERLKDPTLQEYYVGLLPRDNPRDTRFAINFFTTIGLGGLTDDLRDHLKDVSKKLMQQKQEEQAQAMEAESSDESSAVSSEESSSSEDSVSSSSSSDSESSDDDRRKKKKPVRKAKEKNGAERKAKETKEKGKKDIEKSKSITTKDSRKNKDKDRSERTRDKRSMNEIDQINKKDKKKSKSGAEGKKNEREEQFKKLAKLANYGDIEVENQGFQEDRIRDLDERKMSKRDRKEKKNKDKVEKRGKDRRRRAEEEEEEDGYEGPIVIDHRTKRPEMDEYDARHYADRSFESSFDSRDSRGSGGGDSRGMVRRRDDRRGGRFEDRGRGFGRQGPMKKGRDFIEDDMAGRDIRIERNFERMDLYEEKFEREREQTLEQLRGREEFQDYYRDRMDMANRGGPFRDRGRDMPFRGGGSRDRDLIDRFDFDDRGLDRLPDEGRRRWRNRSEDRGPVSVKGDRRKRR